MKWSDNTIVFHSQIDQKQTNWYERIRTCLLFYAQPKGDWINVSKALNCSEFKSKYTLIWTLVHSMAPDIWPFTKHKTHECTISTVHEHDVYKNPRVPILLVFCALLSDHINIGGDCAVCACAYRAKYTWARLQIMPTKLLVKRIRGKSEGKPNGAHMETGTNRRTLARFLLQF